MLKEEMDACQVTPSLTQSRTLKQMSQAGTLTREYLHHLFTEEKPNQRQKFFLNQEDVQRYFPKHYTPQQMQQVILHLLHTWQHKRGCTCWNCTPAANVYDIIDWIDAEQL
ncbi:hypothetical protein [uncultured Gemmiger sp.]|uniref:hypothetical protein n=1 Tax=uncultured Gemmiger sp. TaxID=1623490 RepID=UPI0025E77337|nr:hypothetical protein [uncultured Gemmiger sp.]